jgi:hypothetical protein
VTAGLYSKLNQMDDWNSLIVHYLGLDHIDHAFGAFNSLIEDKLSEMDEIIEKNLFKNDEKWSSFNYRWSWNGWSSYVEAHVL